MLLIPLLMPFALIAFLLFMERVQDVVLGDHPEQPGAERVPQSPAATGVRAPERSAQRSPHQGDAGRARSSRTGGSGPAPRNGRLLETRGRAVHRHQVRSAGGGSAGHRESTGTEPAWADAPASGNRAA